jgi:hypothetical protein
MQRRLLIALVAGVAVLLVLGSGAAANSSKARTSKDTYIDFRMPSNNVFCAYISSAMSGLKPKPSSTGCVEGSRGVSADINVYGRATYPCSSDTVYNTHARMLAYGTTWRHGGFVCKSQTSGLRCTNKSAHGFFLSRQHSYRF